MIEASSRVRSENRLSVSGMAQYTSVTPDGGSRTSCLKKIGKNLGSGK